MIVDTSALIAIFQNEADAEILSSTLAASSTRIISAVSVYQRETRAALRLPPRPLAGGESEARGRGEGTGMASFIIMEAIRHAREASIVMLSKKGEAGLALLDELLSAAQFEIAPLR
jgi:uncharacterized protein with PIN domain